MRVPVIERQVMPSQAPTSAPMQTRADTTVAEGVGRLGQSAAAFLGGVAALAEKKRQEALAIDIADGEREFESFATSRLEGVSDPTEAAFHGVTPGPGYLSTRGKNASAAAAPVLAELERERARIVGRLHPEARERFDARSRAQLEDYRRTVERHSARGVEEARLEALKSTKDRALRQVFLSPDTPGGAATDGLHIRLGELGMSQEERDAFAGEMLATRIDGFLARKELDEAKKVFNASKSLLPAGSTKHIASILARAEESRDKDALESEASALASKFVETSRWRLDDKGGRVETRSVNVDEVNNLLRAVDDSKRPGLRSATMDSVAKLLRAENDARAARVGSIKSQVVSFANTGKTPPANLISFLNDPYDGDPAWLHQFETARKREARLAVAVAQKDRPTESALRREQNDEDEEALSLYRAELYENPESDPDEFLSRWAEEQRGRGRDVGVSNKGHADLVEERAKLRSTFNAKEMAERSRAIAIMRDGITKAMKQPGKKTDESLLRKRLGSAIERYDQEMAANGGKPLDGKRVNALIAESIAPTVVEPGVLGTSLGAKKGMAIDLFSPDAGVSDAGVPSGVRTFRPQPNAGLREEMVSVESTATGKLLRIPRSRLGEALKAGVVRMPK